MSKFNCDKCKYMFEKHNVPPFKEDGSPNYATECPKCQGEAYIHYESSGRVITSGPVNSIDKVVGREANKRWMEQEERKSKRNKVRRESGSVAVEIAKVEKDASGKINYEYKSVDKERLQQRKEVYTEKVEKALHQNYLREKAELEKNRKK